MQLVRRESGVYYISAYCDDDCDDCYCIDSETIAYCPMCGRKLTKETT